MWQGISGSGHRVRRGMPQLDRIIAQFRPSPFPPLRRWELAGAAADRALLVQWSVSVLRHRGELSSCRFTSEAESISTKKILQPRWPTGTVLLCTPSLDFWEPALVCQESRVSQFAPRAYSPIHEESPSGNVRVLHATKRTALVSTASQSYSTSHYAGVIVLSGQIFQGLPSQSL
jgi:hypothetical protein